MEWHLRDWIGTGASSLLAGGLWYWRRRSGKPGISWRVRVGTFLTKAFMLEMSRMEVAQLTVELARCRELCHELSDSDSGSRKLILPISPGALVASEVPDE